MRADVVVDVGNTRIKWGRCVAGAVVEAVSLPPPATASWQLQRDQWHRGKALTWVISGVHPAHRDRLTEWVRGQGDAVTVLDSARQLPLVVRLEHPDRAGIDRLLNAVAVNTRRPTGAPAVIVDAGSAVTVDWIDGDGAFCGGAIFPGLRLMTKALNDHTALLPLVDVAYPPPAMPGATTRAAMEAGVYAAVVGGIQALVRRLAAQSSRPPQLYLGGGDGPTLEPGLNTAGGGDRFFLWPEMTLEGLRLAAERWP